RRIDERLHSVSLYNLDLTRKIHDFPISSSAGAVIADGVSRSLEVPTPVSLDATYALLRQIGDMGGEVPADVWNRLHQEIRNRDSAIYERQTRDPASVPEFSESD